MRMESRRGETCDWAPRMFSHRKKSKTSQILVQGRKPDLYDVRERANSLPTNDSPATKLMMTAKRTRIWLIFSLLATMLAFQNVSDALADEPHARFASFIRGINLNGPGIEIDGHKWQGNDSSDLECNGKAFESQNVKLKPKTDARRQSMIRSSRWGTTLDVKLNNLDEGSYRVFLYVWEDNNSEQFEILVNDRTVVKKFVSGRAGEWKRLGPWNTTSRDGVIKISARGGTANFSGIEIWSGEGTLPDIDTSGDFNRAPTAEQLAFFESKIRPLLVERCYECHSAEAAEVGGGLDQYRSA